MHAPSFLARFDLRALEADPTTLVALDTSGVIVWLNAAWTRFALANGGDDIPARFGPGTSYFAGISGELCNYYERAFATSLATGEPFQQDYECSSPDLFRLHHLRVLPLPSEGLLLEHTPIVRHEQHRPAAVAIEIDYRDRNGLLHQCSNCRRTRARDGSWRWVPEWVARPPPRTSHGICKVCLGYYWPREALTT